ncbi:hypothetical protein C8F04DRAFT_980653, partial [Mycena alexandri]
VGNIPFNMDEATMIEIFETVGPIIDFRISVDPQTAKSNGCGFCDFYDKETAAAAVHQFNNLLIGGRTLRVNLSYLGATSEKWSGLKNELPDGRGLGRLEIATTEETTEKKTTIERQESGFLAYLPPGRALAEQEEAKDTITRTMASVSEGNLIEILAQMKAFVYTHPKEARELFQHHPQLTYAIVMGLILARVYPPETFTTIQGTISSNIDGIRPPINGLLQSETTTSPQASLKPPFTTSRAPAPETIDRTSEPERSETKVCTHLD